jgi:hypothetical protein
MQRIAGTRNRSEVTSDARNRPFRVPGEVVKLLRRSGRETTSRSREMGKRQMPSTRRWIALGLLLAAPALLAEDAPQSSTPQQKPQHHKSHKAHKPAPKPLVLPPLPSGPLSQVPMDQLPPAPAKVSYENGKLAIYAQNSTLSEILRDVRKLTGASIDIPQGAAANERVVTHLGPGAPRDVLSGLLNGSSFNYVMIGSSSDPAAIASVMLSAKTATPGQTQTAANVYQNNPGAMPPNRFPPQPQPFGQAMIPQPGQAVVQQANTETTEEAKDEEENPDENADNTDDQGQAGQAGVEVQDQQQAQDPNQPNAGPRTPEQIMEMLRRQPQPGSPIIPPGQPPQQQ